MSIKKISNITVNVIKNNDVTAPFLSIEYFIKFSENTKVITLTTF